MTMITSWATHGVFTAAAGLIDWRLALFTAGMYTGREVFQHQFKGTRGGRAWLDRIMDALVPAGVALWFIVRSSC